MGQIRTSFYMLINPVTEEPLEAALQPLTNKMSEVLKFRKDKLKGIPVITVVVYPGSPWESRCPVFPDGYNMATAETNMGGR